MNFSIQSFPIDNFRKAASAALVFLSATAFSPVVASNPGETPLFQTIPAHPSEEEAFDNIRQAYSFRLSETPALIRNFISEFPASPARAQATLLLANWYFYQKEYPTALKYYSELPEGAFSGSVKQQMLYCKGVALIKTGFYSEAESIMRKIAYSSAYGADARFYLAYIDYVNGNYDAAYRQFITILADKGSGLSASQNAEAEYYINQIDYRNGEYRKVANTSERLLSGRDIPSELRGETLRVGGLSFFKLGDKVSARHILSNYIDLAGDGAEISALYALASIYYDEGNFEKALPLFSIVTEYPGPIAQSAWLYIGQIYLSLNDNAAAALAFDKAARESWSNDVAETAAYNLAVTSAEGMGLPFSDGAAAMENFIESFPASPYASSLSSYLANAYYARHDYANALRQIEKVDGNDANKKALRQKILYQMGVESVRQGNPREALTPLSEASQPSGPDAAVSAQASLWLGDALYATSDFREAAKAYKRALDSNLLGDNTALASYNLGYAYMKVKDYRQAEKAFQKALSGAGLTASQKADARLRYADCLYYNGDYSKSLAIFRDIKIEGGSDGVFARIREADILGREGKVKEKISILEGVVADSQAGPWLQTALSRLADAYSEAGDDRKAASLYARLIEADPGSSDIAQNYFSLATNADNLYKAGDTEAAYKAYKTLEASGIPALYPSAITGVMRTAPSAGEVALYAEKVVAIPGLSAEDADEAIYLRATSLLAMDDSRNDEALAALAVLAQSADRLWGAKAAVALGEELLSQGKLDEAEKVLLDMIDAGSDEPYWLARGYIALADVYYAQDKDYLAQLYLETLQSNYPGADPEISRMIKSRLK